MSRKRLAATILSVTACVAVLGVGAAPAAALLPPPLPDLPGILQPEPAPPTSEPPAPAPPAPAPAPRPPTNAPGPARLLNPGDLPADKQFGFWDAAPARPMNAQFLCEEDAFPLAHPRVIAGVEPPTENTSMYRLFTSHPDASGKRDTILAQYGATFATLDEARFAVKLVKACFAEREQRAQVSKKARKKLTVRTKHIDLADGLTTGIVRLHRASKPDEVTLWAVGRDGSDVTALVLPMRTDEVPGRTWRKVAKQALERVAS